MGTTRAVTNDFETQTRKQSPLSNRETRITQMLTNHLQSFARKDVAGIMQDDSEESVFVTPSGPLHGLAAIRNFFETFIHALPANFFDSFRMNRQEVHSEVAYIAWEAAPWIQLGTDSFLVRDEKILVQTFASYPPFPSA